MVIELHEADPIDFGDLPEPVNKLLQKGVVAYRNDRSKADQLFRAALDLTPEVLPTYYCLYKIHTYQGNLDDALAVAEQGLAEAARQAKWENDWRRWTPQIPLPDGAGRFALYTLKALAFIHLRRNEPDAAVQKLGKLAFLDPAGSVGWPVVAALADSLVLVPT